MEGSLGECVNTTQNQERIRNLMGRLQGLKDCGGVPFWLCVSEHVGLDVGFLTPTAWTQMALLYTSLFKEHTQPRDHHHQQPLSHTIHTWDLG